ncbi:MAG: ComEC family competence protein [Rickettsiales bacterium]|jgi:competence protein ComEC|nr:ComEC family competence protein [Rickettsiales bacterium]
MPDRFLFLSIFAFASGAALYFSLPAEPVVRFPILLCVLLLACFIRYRWLIFVFLLGFFYSSFRTGLTDTKLLRHGQRNAEVAGVIEDIDYTDRNQRVFVRTPDDFLLRISVPKNQSCAIGSEISLRADLYAPMPADAFNKFDYRRWSFFNGLSATGTARAGGCPGGNNESLRAFVRGKADNKLADSLVLGYKNAIPKSDFEKIKAAGIAHVFSISGYHLTLVGGWLFFVFLTLAKCFPAVVRRIPARNVALPPTAAGLCFYLVLSGSGVATIRSFIMASAGFFAMMLNRRVLTLRNAALVFGVMIAAKPFWLVSAGFQMSFAAIFGLLCFFENRKTPNIGKTAKFFYFLGMSTLVATIWTFPFVAYHFGSFPIYGLIGNMALLPVFSIAIMPLVLIGTITSVFGWRFPFVISDWLYDAAIGFAGRLASLPFAQAGFGDIPGFALFLAFAGMTLFVLARKKSACVLFACALFYAVFQPSPVLRATSDGEVVGFSKNGKTCFNVNYSEKHPFIIPRGNKLRADCRKGICEYKTENWTAVSAQRFLPLAANMGKLCDYDFIISYLPLELPACQNKVVSGGARIYSDGEVEKIEANRWLDR